MGRDKMFSGYLIKYMYTATWMSVCMLIFKEDIFNRPDAFSVI